MSVSRLDPKKWTKDGRKWNFHVRYKDLDGKTKQYQSKLFKTKPEAQEAERIFLLELDNCPFGYLPVYLLFQCLKLKDWMYCALLQSELGQWC